MGWLTLIWDVPPSCPAAQPVLPISHQPWQNQAEGGTAKIKVNPTEVRQEMSRPGLGRIGDQVSVDPEDPANDDLFGDHLEMDL